MVIWITGLSSAGKTTIGRNLYELWNKEASNTVLVDGDEMRNIFKHDKGPVHYSLEGRRQNAERICEICAWLDRQEINVVCCILSLFEASRNWNRKNYSKYFEVYVSAPMEVLIKRDKKNIYGPAMRGESKNVVGIDIPFTAPSNPDMVIDNSEEDLDIRSISMEILRRAKEK